MNLTCTVLLLAHLGIITRSGAAYTLLVLLLSFEYNVAEPSFEFRFLLWKLDRFVLIEYVKLHLCVFTLSIYLYISKMAYPFIQPTLSIHALALAHMYLS